MQSNISPRLYGPANIHNALVHGTDGPVTDFVLIMRALRLVANGADPEVVGNVLHETMLDRGHSVSG